MTERGYTLVEVLVSVLLLAVALAPLLQLYPSLLRANEAQRDLGQLAAVASAKVEELSAGVRAGSVGVGTGSQPCTALPRCHVDWEVATDQQAGAVWLRRLWVVACVDADGDLTCGAAEPQVRYETKVASRP